MGLPIFPVFTKHLLWAILFSTTTVIIIVMWILPHKHLRIQPLCTPVSCHCLALDPPHFHLCCGLALLVAYSWPAPFQPDFPNTATGSCTSQLKTAVVPHIVCGGTSKAMPGPLVSLFYAHVLPALAPVTFQTPGPVLPPQPSSVHFPANSPVLVVLHKLSPLPKMPGELLFIRRYLSLKFPFLWSQTCLL